MDERAWRKIPLVQALADLAAPARAALATGPLCDACLGRLFAQVGSGMSNIERGRLLRSATGQADTAASCSLCGGLFDAIDAWTRRAAKVLEGWEFATLAVASRVDPRIAEREEALWLKCGIRTAEPYKQAFNRALGIALADTLRCETDPADPDIVVVAEHARGEVSVRVQPLFVTGRYRKLVRGIPQCRWRAWPTSVQQIVGDPICRSAAGEDHLFHGCGREDVDVRCLGERPMVVEIVRPRRRSLDWSSLAAEINASGQVEVVRLAPCRRTEVTRLKTLRPEKTYRAMVRMENPVEPSRLKALDGLVGVIEQRTPARVLRRRRDLVRRRRVLSLQWRAVDDRTLELTIRTQAGTYIKELVSGDAGRTRPSVAGVLDTAARCEELDVLAIHLD